MRTEADVRAAAELLAWFWAVGHGLKRLDLDSENTVIGVTAAVEWVLGGGPNPVTEVLRDIAAMRQGPGRN